MFNQLNSVRYQQELPNSVPAENFRRELVCPSSLRDQWSLTIRESERVHRLAIYHALSKRVLNHIRVVDHQETNDHSRSNSLEIETI